MNENQEAIAWQQRQQARAPRCGSCRGSGYARDSLGGLDPDDVCAACGGSGVDER